MNDDYIINCEPSGRAKLRALEILGYNALGRPATGTLEVCVNALAQHLEDEDKAAREAIDIGGHALAFDFARRHILPDPKPTVQDIMRKHIGGGSDYDALAEALRDAGLLRED